MAKITILKSSHLPVILQIDVLEYYQSYLMKGDNSCADCTETFDHQKNLFLDELTDIKGEMLWLEIKKELALRWDRDNEKIKFTERFFDNDDKMLPMAISSLNSSFTELLKNTIDAFLDNLSKNQAIDYEKEKLEMSINLSIDDNKIVVEISDNAGGFPENYLSRFGEYIEEKKYKSEQKVSDKKDNDLYFGGAAKGMRAFLSYLLEGEIMERAGKSIKKFEVQNTTSIALENKLQGNRKGMKMTITSSLEPCKEYDDLPKLETLKISPAWGKFSLYSNSNKNQRKNGVNLLISLPTQSA
ncbi:ATP-binding protein [Legionella fairfieldensis]|uniref:ATP-binding protein n=1 Tax=Legionella fairfieldensis TaxID=45064 RepID=UPI00049222AD|nr:ATP-binding protein [Legionella fairfieldensis]